MVGARTVWISGLLLSACGGGGGAGGPPDASVSGTDAAGLRIDAAPPPSDAAPPPSDAAPPDAPSPDAAGGPCVAESPAALLACGAAVTAGSADTIEVRGQIVCSGADACKLDIEYAPGPYVIRGAPGAVIRREDHYDYHLIQLVAPTDATVQDLIIDERADAPCVPIMMTNPPVENPDCKASIFVYGAPHLVVEDVVIAHAKAQALLVAMSPSVTVTRSRFTDAHEFGIEITGLNESLLIEDSLVWHSASNGIVLYDTHGTRAAPLVVRRTLLQHNHLNSIFYNCGAGNDPCGGGQFLVAGLVDFLTVEGSVIRDGSNEFFPDIAIGGVELNPPGFNDITFTGDDIHTHGMWGIYANPDQVDSSNVQVTDSKMYGNGTAMYYDGVNVGNFDPGVASETGTCEAPTCLIVPFGALWATPVDGIQWTSNDLAAPQVTVDGAVVATDPAGAVRAAPGSTVILLDGATEIDRLVAP